MPLGLLLCRKYAPHRFSIADRNHGRSIHREIALACLLAMALPLQYASAQMKAKAPSRPVPAPRFGALGAEAAIERCTETTSTGPRPVNESEPETRVKLPGPQHVLPTGDHHDEDVEINGVNCFVPRGEYAFRNVNIWGGGSLTFEDAAINFHAHSILVENGGTLEAGFDTPITGPVTIWLYGSAADGIPSITCKSGPMCGVPTTIWNSNPNVPMKMVPMPSTPCKAAGAPPVGSDCFYQYEKLDSTDADGAFFGRKVLALSYGGTIFLRGAKGIRSGAMDAAPSDSGTSWVRLTEDLKAGVSKFHVDRAVPTWVNKDQIVLTSTDYLPGHSEQLTIQSVGSDAKGTVINLQAPTKYPHYGTAYDYSGLPANAGPQDDPNRPKSLLARHLETRAAVALLTRSIMIASEGASPVFADRYSPHFTSGYYGGHTVMRAGFKQLQIQGVEYYQLGQGGIIGRYPIHFHMDRKVPLPTVDPLFQGTYVTDSSIHDSNTRFITVHATQGVLLARNVGYRSIGHGFYLEDATEINNRLYSNIGIQARAAVYDDLNDREVPGILARPGESGAEVFPFHSDYDHPSVFWIMNTWNDLQYNVAVGAGTCGACYWMPPSAISGSSVYETWDSYAGMQTTDRAGVAPMMNFVGNSCSTAMNALETVGDTAPCLGVVSGFSTLGNTLGAVPNPTPTDYPNVNAGLRQHATLCDAANQADCTQVPICTGLNGGEADCAATVIDHFTTSFNWASKNFAAVWLRGWWYLMQNSAITDVQGGGLTSVTGGGYTRSDAAQGFWNLSLRNLFVGNTQPNTSNGVPDNAAASNAGPFNPYALSCPYNGDHCVSTADGISIPVDSFGNAQRLFNIYDGPVFEDSDAFADIHTTKVGTLSECKAPVGGNNNPGECQRLGWENAYQQGVLQSPQGNLPNNDCILPNAAIAWKQPNGFYYPPAFHSKNLAFKDVDIRHYVVEPLWKPNSFVTDFDKVKSAYCTWEPGLFGANFTDIDRQTELSDDDGALTGLVSTTVGDAISEPTISVNKDPFFNSPLVTPECSSSIPGTEATADTSPYQYASTVVYHYCSHIGTKGEVVAGCAEWGGNCTDQSCSGVPLYRQYLTNDEFTAFQKDPTTRPTIHLMGQVSVQRSNLTVNHGSYYIDTTLSAAQQTGANPNIFMKNEIYYIFFPFATSAFHQTYSMYVGNVSQAEGEATVQPARVQLPDQKYITKTTEGNWITGKTYDPKTGLLTVTIDLGQQGNEFATDREQFCQPTSYCSYNKATKTCGCNPNNPACKKADMVCSWGVRDIDCPIAGCFGFAITMPDAFVATKQPGLPPVPIRFTGDPGSDTYFNKGNVTFFNVSSGIAGSCRYPAPPEQP
jgi:G8 domain